MRFRTSGERAEKDMVEFGWLSEVEPRSSLFTLKDAIGTRLNELTV